MTVTESKPGRPGRPGVSRCLVVGLSVWVGASLPGSAAAAAVAAEPAPGIGAAGSTPLSWCDSTDRNKLDLVVRTDRGRYFLSNRAGYDPPDRNCYSFVNWDLQGTPSAAKPIVDLEVEAQSLYLVHLYEISKPRTLGDFWDKDPLKAASVAFVWVGGEPAGPRTGIEPEPGSEPGPRSEPVLTLAEIRESPSWFHYEKGDRLPIFTRRFPEFRLPPGKVLSLAVPRTQDVFDDCRRRGVTHFQSGGGSSDALPPLERLITLPTGFFNEGLGEKPSGDPHISPTENTFLSSDPALAIRRAGIARSYEYIFLDEEFWHNDYQPGTIERLCLFAREARRLNPSVKLADFWNPPPYVFSFIGRDRWTVDSVRAEALSHYDSIEAALRSGNPALLRRVMVEGKETSLAEELSAVSLCVYFDNLFGTIEPYATFSNDFFVPAAIHSTRVNKRLPVNAGKPLIWFGMEILEGKYEHPRIAYPTRTAKPPGWAIFHERLPVSPNLNEAIAVFGLLEGDGVYLWEPHGPSDGDPDGIFSTLQYCLDYKDDRGEWRPDVPGTPFARAPTWYPAYLYAAPDFYALGAWKFSRIADIVTRGRRVDFEYSLDGGTSWYTPPRNGGTMADVIRDKRPIVTGAVHGRDIALVVFHPFQGVADRTSLRIRYEGSVFSVDLFGTRVRVYRGALAGGGSSPRS